MEYFRDKSFWWPFAGQCAVVGLTVLLAFGAVAHGQEAPGVVEPSGEGALNPVVTEAIGLINSGRIYDAILKLETALADNPHDLAIRTVLARAYLSPESRSPQDAIQTLVDGLPFASNDPAYVREVFRVLMLNGQYALVVDLAYRVLPEEPQENPTLAFIAMTTAAAHYERYEFGPALQLLVDYNLAVTNDGLTLYLKILWDRGEKEKAFTLLNTAINARPLDDRLLARAAYYASELGDYERAIRYNVQRSVQNPENPVPRLEMIRHAWNGGDELRAKREFDRFLDDFQTNESALMMLANEAADLSLAGFLDRIRLRAERFGFRTDLYALMKIEALIRAQKDDDAVASIAETERRYDFSTGDKDRHRQLLAIYRALAFHGQGRTLEADGILAGYMDNNPDPATLAMLIDRLVERERIETARDVIDRATIRYPLDNNIQEKALRFRLDHGGDIFYATRLLLPTRRLDMETLKACRARIVASSAGSPEIRKELLVQIDFVLDNMRQSRGMETSVLR